MTSPRHFFWFLSLGLFWGVSPVLYKHLANIGMPVSHTIVFTGLGVGSAMTALAVLRGGWQGFNSQLALYGLGCAGLMNIPFGINLAFAGHVPPTELAIIITTSPFFNYLIALVNRTENASPRRLLAITLGFVSALILILSRDGTLSGEISWWLIGSLSIPLLYCAYNNFAARYFPANASTLHVGAAESFASGLWALPFLLTLAPPGTAGLPPLPAYWVLLAATAMWIIERIAYFILINEKGAVYTTQATYLSVPFGVIFSALIFGGAQDLWLWMSLALLMGALWFNNTGSSVAVRAPVSTHPNS
jgi:drug/metabolite transporter (DMT)-like permease